MTQPGGLGSPAVPDPITVSGVVLCAEDGTVLTVRKRGARRFQLPGGKPEPGEDARAAAVRECQEEIGVELDPAALRLLGTFRAAAANEPGHEVIGTIFLHPAPAHVAAAAEIAELRWLDPAGPLPDDLALLLSERVVPAILADEPVGLPGSAGGTADG